jgi:hypothetical protein
MASSERTEAANATSTAAASNTTSAPAVASAPAAVAGAEGRRDGERQPSGPEAATKALKDGGPIKPRELLAELTTKNWRGSWSASCCLRLRRMYLAQSWPSLSAVKSSGTYAGATGLHHGGPNVHDTSSCLIMRGRPTGPRLGVNKEKKLCRG